MQRHWIGVGLSFLLMLAALSFYFLYWKNPFLRTDYRSEFRRYFTNDPAKLRNLRGKGASWMDTHLVMNFELDEPLRYPTTPSLKHLEGKAARRYLQVDDCAPALKESSLITLDYQPQPKGDVMWENLPGPTGRIIVRNSNQYCVFVWEMS